MTLQDTVFCSLEVHFMNSYNNNQMFVGPLSINMKHLSLSLSLSLSGSRNIKKCFMHFLKPGFPISCKDRKYMSANTFLLSFLRMPLSSRSCNDQALISRRLYIFCHLDISVESIGRFICCQDQSNEEPLFILSQFGSGSLGCSICSVLFNQCNI